LAVKTNFGLFPGRRNHAGIAVLHLETPALDTIRSARSTPAPMSDPSSIPPLPENATPEEKDAHWLKYVYQGDSQKQLTWRAVLTGGLIGMAMTLAHLYTSLQLGWGFGVAITACVISYVGWNGFARLTGGRMTPLSMLENNCMQSTASAAGYSTGTTVSSAFAALLLVQGVHQPWYVLAPMVLFTAILGVFIAIPMKRQMINHEQLPFPSGIAAAETLRSLYTHGTEALAKAKALLLALGAGGLIGLLRGWELMAGAREGAKLKPGIIEWLAHSWIRIPAEVPLDRMQPIAGKKLAGLAFDPSALLIAAGMLVGVRVSISILLSSVITYFVLAPWLYGMDVANAGVAGYVPSFSFKGDTFNPVRWALWLGTSIMVFSSLMALALQWKTVARAFRKRESGADNDALDRIEVPGKWFTAGVIPAGIALIITMWLSFNINPLLGVFAVLLSFVIALVCSRATGETDTTPTGAMGKVTQLTYAVLPGAAGDTTINLMSAGATSSVGLATADLLTDLKSGYLLGANPRKQFLAQFAGVFFGTLAVIPFWYLMVPDKAALEKYPAIAAQMWRAVADLLTQGLQMLPFTAKVAIVIGAFVGILLPVIEKVARKARAFLPSAMGLGLGFVMPFQNSLSFAIGAVLAWVWMRANRKQAENYNVPIASGLIAGEALIGGVIAIICTLIALTAAAVVK
jgi:OPT family oligopeptide transporter